jgi:SET domain-containing protein
VTGKSRIHGFGVFAKVSHKAGDMMIEYIGELVRPPISDIRERRIYNSLVGAGTYMFRIDDERVIDATRAGSIAHLINHSCEPNCYSRVISVLGDEHIIIFAKRDINPWEELTYDYR